MLKVVPSTDLLGLLLGLDNSEMLEELFFLGPVAMVIRTVPENPPDARFDGPNDINIEVNGLAIEFYPIVGDPWVLSENWTGCDTYVFITNARPISSLNNVTIWSQDLDGLLQASPKNVHYFFVATTQSSGAMAFLENMQIQVETLMNQLPAADAEHWKDRLHVAGLSLPEEPSTQRQSPSSS